MKIKIRGEKVEITESIKNYIEEKVGRLSKYFTDSNKVEATVLVKVKSRNQSVEVTIPTSKFVLRREETSKDLYAAIDKVTDKLERQIRKSKTKIEKRFKDSIITFDDDAKVEKENNDEIIKRKDINSKPMSEDEAILELELLGHDFFAFKNANEDCVSIVYKRKEKDYGLLNIR